MHQHGITDPVRPSMTRREALRTICSTALVATAATTATTSVARLSGINDAAYTSRKFDTAGFYAFASGQAGSGIIVRYAFRDGCDLIALSDGPDFQANGYVSSRRFDLLCWGKCATQAETEKTGRRQIQRAA